MVLDTEAEQAVQVVDCDVHPLVLTVNPRARAGIGQR